MTKERKYVWREQYRESPTDPWKDSPVPARVYISDAGITYGYHGDYENAFYLKDGAPLPDEVFRIAGHLPDEDFFIRQILESKDNDGNRIIREIREYPKASNKKIAPDDGVAYAICIYEECGAKIVPERASQHLREAHGFRQKQAMKIDYTNPKYFKIVIEHGTKAKEGASVKALRKGKKERR